MDINIFQVHSQTSGPVLKNDIPDFDFIDWNTQVVPELNHQETSMFVVP